MATACSLDIYPSDLRSSYDSGCFGRGRRTPSPQGNGSHRSFFTLPPFARAFRSSRPTAEHLYTHNQNQTERRNEYNDPLNDPAWPTGYNNTMGQQPTFSNDNDPPLPYSYPAPPQVPQYSSYRDASTYSNPTTLPPINPSENRDERWQQQNLYEGTSATSRVSEPLFSPVPSFPEPSFQYPPQDPSQGMLSEHRFSLPIDTPTSPSTVTVRRGPVLVERTTTRSSAHATSPYSRHPPASDTRSHHHSHNHSHHHSHHSSHHSQHHHSHNPSHPPHHSSHNHSHHSSHNPSHHSSHNPSHSPPHHRPTKKKRKRADANQLRVLNEVYARTAFPSTEERQRLAEQLDMTPRSVQIWFQNKRQSMRNTHRQSGRGPGSDNPPSAHHSVTSRSASNQSGVSTIPMPPHRPSSVSANPHQATYISPSPTDPSYFSLSRTSQPQQGPSTQFRPQSRNRENLDDYYDGGGSRRSRV